jgi:surface antigen
MEASMPKSTQSLLPALIAGTSLLLALGHAPAALADPPAWAGHGHEDGDERRDDRRDDRPDRDWRERHERHEHYDRDDRPHDYGRRAYGRHEGGYYRGYGGDDWDDDYGIVRSGRCNTDAVLGVVGAVTGGIIGHNAGGPRDRGVATVLGAIAGGVIGTAIGSSIDDGDRACMGHALELAPIGRPVLWVNPRTHANWRLVPVRDVSPTCREFDLYREGRHSGRERVVACRRGRGDWAFGRD